jgi:hypothetical protein
MIFYPKGLSQTDWLGFMHSILMYGNEYKLLSLSCRRNSCGLDKKSSKEISFLSKS